MSKWDDFRFSFWAYICKACIAIGWPTGAIGAIALMQRIADRQREKLERMGDR